MKMLFRMATLFACLLAAVQAQAANFTLNWDPVTLYTDGTPCVIGEYRIFYSPASYSGLRANVPIVVPGSQSSHTFDFIFNKEFYIALTAVTAVGEESALSRIGYFLKGNVFDERSEVSTAVVNVADMQTFATPGYFGSTVVPARLYDENLSASDFTPQRRCDINMDSRIDWYDQTEIGLNYGAASK